MKTCVKASIVLAIFSTGCARVERGSEVSSNQMGNAKFSEHAELFSKALPITNIETLKGKLNAKLNCHSFKSRLNLPRTENKFSATIKQSSSHKMTFNDDSFNEVVLRVKGGELQGVYADEYSGITFTTVYRILPTDGSIIFESSLSSLPELTVVSQVIANNKVDDYTVCK